MRRLLGTLSVMALFGIGLAATTRRPSPSPLVIHEWGTITTHHGPTGVPEGGLNRVTNAEPLPGFVHRYDPSPPGRRRIPLLKSDIADGSPDITMRLETPVMYFHPAPGAQIPPFDVSVDFRGGILNEFYPNADATAHGWNAVHLSDSVVSSLHWSNVRLNDAARLQPTPSRVWLAPRAVHSTPITAAGESEQYIFYRGMANLPALLRTELTRSGVRVSPPRQMPWLDKPSTALGRIWLVDVRANGTAAFRTSESLVLTKGDASHPLAELNAFTQDDYSAGTIATLRSSMHDALVARGLDDDEATAMLATWNVNYFVDPGLRIFYLVPNEWTSYYLPLTISTPHTLTRVIVGRIDLPAALWL